jgi:hypothetical protein
LIFNDPVVPSTGGGYFGHVVIGSGLYSSFYFLTEDGEVDRSQAHNPGSVAAGVTPPSSRRATRRIRIPLP